MDCMQNASLPCTSLFPEVCSGSCPLSQWCPQVLSSSPPAFNLFQHQHSFPMSWLFASGAQRIRASASAVAFLMNTQGLFPWGLTGLISLLSKGLSRVFSSTTIWKHQFFSSLSNCHIVHDYWKKMNSEFLSHAIFHGSWVRMYSSKRVLN